MRACCHCCTLVLEKYRDDKAPDDKIRHVLIALCLLFLHSSLAQHSNNFGHLWRRAVRYVLPIEIYKYKWSLRANFLTEKDG